MHPACIAKPTNTQHVADLVAAIVSHDTPFAIKGGGHAPSAGWANIDNAITIDMGGLSTISVNGDVSVARIGAGARWLDVYTFLDPLNRTVAGGRNGAVGVGGLTLGGGISYFSPQVGFTCDTVVNFQVVLASGEVVNANSTENLDLFRALKGGMNNFGIVTRFDFSTLPVGEISGGSVVNNIEDRHAVFKAFANIADAPDYDIRASIVTSVVFSSISKTWTLSSTPIYTAPDLDPPVYKELFAVPSISNTMHLTTLHDFANETALPQNDILFYTSTYGVSAHLLEELFDICNASVHASQVSGGVTWLLTFEPLPSAIVAHGDDQHSGNSLGTSPTDGNSMVLLLTVVWSDTSSSDSVEAEAASLLSKMDQAAKNKKLDRRFRYANYANLSQKPIHSYGAANREFLKKVANRYDRKGTFQKLVPGGFKLEN